MISRLRNFFLVSLLAPIFFGSPSSLRAEEYRISGILEDCLVSIGAIPMELEAAESWVLETSFGKVRRTESIDRANGKVNLCVLGSVDLNGQVKDRLIWTDVESSLISWFGKAAGERGWAMKSSGDETNRVYYAFSPDSCKIHMMAGSLQAFAQNGVSVADGLSEDAMFVATDQLFVCDVLNLSLAER